MVCRLGGCLASSWTGSICSSTVSGVECADKVVDDCHVEFIVRESLGFADVTEQHFQGVGLLFICDAFPLFELVKLSLDNGGHLSVSWFNVVRAVALNRFDQVGDIAHIRCNGCQLECLADEGVASDQVTDVRGKLGVHVLLGNDF